MNKKFLFVLVASLMVLAFAIPAQAGVPTISLDNTVMTFEADDVAPFMENNRVLVPMRKIFEAQGATVTWEEATQTVTGIKGDVTLKLTVGGAVYKNDVELDIDVPAQLVNGRTMVPVRVVSEGLGATVTWDEATETVSITSAVVTQEPAAEVPATEEPVTEQPTTEVPATEEPAAEQPTTEVPATEEPAAEQPATEEPAAE
ncbi:MAG TPA: hypothetical protein DEF36_16940 [Desulfotomaculum sp.]|nr:hypothetical protein [Desulfotomaculum sp.]